MMSLRQRKTKLNKTNLKFCTTTYILYIHCSCKSTAELKSLELAGFSGEKKLKLLFHCFFFLLQFIQ